jgi:hypothetical protein
MDWDQAGFCGLNRSGPARVCKKRHLKHSYCAFVAIYSVFFARFGVPRAVLLKPWVSDFTPGIYRVFFARFGVPRAVLMKPRVSCDFTLYDVRTTTKSPNDEFLRTYLRR